MYYISEGLLLKSKSYKKGMDDENPTQFKKVLFLLGMDINKSITTEINTHRVKPNEPAIYSGVRWVGEERTDKVWLRSGCASVDAHINSTNDKSLQEELHNMSREGYSGDVYEEMVERAAALAAQQSSSKE